MNTEGKKELIATSGISFPSAVLWDMDGVLVDSKQLHFISWQKAFQTFGISITYEQFQPYFGCSPSVTLKGLLGNKLYATAAANIRQQKVLFFNRSISSAIRPTPGAKQWLRFFSGSCPQAVASSAPLDTIELILVALEIRSYFQCVVSMSDERSKPEPDVYFKAASDLGVPPSSCLAIEDSSIGIKAAKAAGVKVIAICTTSPAEKLFEADLVLPNLESLSQEHIKTLSTSS